MPQLYGRDDNGLCGWYTPDPRDNVVISVTDPAGDGNNIIVLTVTPDDGTAPYTITLPDVTHQNICAALATAPDLGVLDV